MPKDFGFMKTADHWVLNEDQESRLHHKYVMVVQDLACKTKLARETQWFLRKF